MAVEGQQDDVEQHPLLIWTSLRTGDVVSLSVPTQEYVGAVGCTTSDGLIIWIGDDLNERNLFHFRDCQSVYLIRGAVY
jgi:hypothetical protein